MPEIIEPPIKPLPVISPPTTTISLDGDRVIKTVEQSIDKKKYIESKVKELTELQEKVSNLQAELDSLGISSGEIITIQEKFKQLSKP